MTIAAGEIDVMLTAEQVAAQLQCSVKTVRRLAYAGRLRYQRLGRELRFRQAWVDAWKNGVSPYPSPTSHPQTREVRKH